MKLTAAQVAEYSAPNAFATPRTQSRGFAGGSTSDSSTKRRVATADSSESQRLLSGASDRVGKIETNLNSMLELALEGSRASTTDARRAEVFGLMRSLSAGIDEIVDQTKFKGEQVLDGRALRLSGAGASSSIRLGNLSSSGKGGLGLATRDAGAVVEVLYDDYCEWRNQNVGLVGLDITEARSADAKASASELADGRYELEVIYGGKESSVIIRELNGSERSRVDNVDLSGTGIETVRFDIGVEIDIDKKQASQSVDKYDWELLGKPSLYAKLDYTRVNTHDLTGSAEVEGPSATLSVNALGLSDAGGSFNIVDVGRGAVASGQTELESGDYRIEVHNRGEKSTAFLFDSGGRMVGSVDEVDLREEGELTLDFGNGLNVTVSQQGFSGSGTLTALASYKRETQPYEDFDFKGYAKALRSALDVVSAQKSILQGAQGQVDITVSAVNGTYSGAGTQSGNSAVLSSLLGQAVGGSLGKQDASSQLAYAQNLIMNSMLNVYGTQANDLSGSILSLFSSTNTAAVSPYASLFG